MIPRAVLMMLPTILCKLVCPAGSASVPPIGLMRGTVPGDAGPPGPFSSAMTGVTKNQAETAATIRVYLMR